MVRETKMREKTDMDGHAMHTVQRKMFSQRSKYMHICAGWVEKRVRSTRAMKCEE